METSNCNIRMNEITAIIVELSGNLTERTTNFKAGSRDVSQKKKDD